MKKEEIEKDEDIHTIRRSRSIHQRTGFTDGVKIVTR